MPDNRKLHGFCLIKIVEVRGVDSFFGTDYGEDYLQNADFLVERKSAWISRIQHFVDKTSWKIGNH